MYKMDLLNETSIINVFKDIVNELKDLKISDIMKVINNSKIKQKKNERM